MKIPVTDQFLWDAYSVVEGLGDIAHFFLCRRRTMWDVAPDIDDPRIKRYFKEFSYKDSWKGVQSFRRGNNEKYGNSF